MRSELGAVTAFAPGRVNLIGEHTDYNAGLVLPIVLRLGTSVSVRRARGDAVRVASKAGLEPRESSYVLGAEARRGDWTDHVQGVTAALARAGMRPGGFEAEVTTNLPLGAGLGSSAALAVALLRALRATFALQLDDLAIARIAHESETTFVGAHVGLMDQLASSCGAVGRALRVDLRDLSRELLALPPFELAVIDSGTRHDHSRGGYNDRRAECEEACRRLGVATLRELENEPIADLLVWLPAPLDARVRHVLTENERVRQAVAALRAGDLGLLGELLRASHRSLRDDYAVSTPALDRLVGYLDDDAAVLGARLVGGGFGGSVIALTRTGHADAAAQRALARYRAGRLVALVP